MSTQDEKWFQELGETAAYNSNPDHEGRSVTLTPEQVWKLVWEIERLNQIASDNMPCGVCDHAYKDHPFDGVICSQFCQVCPGDEDLHNFTVA